MFFFPKRYGFADIFLLGVESGILYPHKSLLGKKRNFQLVIEARDGGGNGQLFDRAVINVQVLNVNEHAPVFQLPRLFNSTVEITEVALSLFKKKLLKSFFLERSQ